MPREPLIDFDALDLSREVVSSDRIRAVCEQRGTFALLDGLLHFDLSGNLAVGYKDLSPDDWWARDHIPRRALFPGVLQLECAAQLCTWDYVHRREPRAKAAGEFIGFGGLDQARFRDVVEPPARLIVAATNERLRSKMFVYRTEGFVGRRKVFEASIRGVIVGA